MTNKKRILFVNDEMEMGGVARVLNTLMTNLSPDKYDIDLLVLHKTGMLLKEVPSHVHVIEGTSFFRTVDRPIVELLKSFDIAALCNKTRLIYYMKTGLIKKRITKERAKMIQKPYDVEVAAKEGFCTIFTAFGDSKRKINWVLTDYSVCNYSKRHMSLVKESLQYIDLNIADSKQALSAYKQVFGVNKGLSLHNLMDTKKIIEYSKKQEDMDQLQEGINIITVARFHPQKSIDRLIIAHKYAMDHGYKSNLYLIGGGEEEDKLKKLVADIKCNNVYFLGYKQNPYADMSRCDLFVLPSLYEGFATVVSESLIAGTPVLSTRVSGIEEQITKPEYGWIVENNQVALNDGLIDALSNPEKLKAKKRSLQDYTYPNDEILLQFEEVL